MGNRLKQGSMHKVLKDATTNTSMIDNAETANEFTREGTMLCTMASGWPDSPMTKSAK